MTHDSLLILCPKTASMEWSDASHMSSKSLVQLGGCTIRVEVSSFFRCSKDLRNSGVNSNLTSLLRDSSWMGYLAKILDEPPVKILNQMRTASTGKGYSFQPFEICPENLTVITVHSRNFKKLYSRLKLTKVYMLT